MKRFKKLYINFVLLEIVNKVCLTFTPALSFHFFSVKENNHFGKKHIQQIKQILKNLSRGIVKYVAIRFL